jgi:hypothetical protein
LITERSGGAIWDRRRRRSGLAREAKQRSGDAQTASRRGRGRGQQVMDVLLPFWVFRGMIRKSGNRFSERIMPKQ